VAGFCKATLILLVSCAAAVVLGANEQFASEVQTVEVYATVTDEKGGPVTGLHQADFQIHEDGQPQEITTFAAGEFPLTLALGVDRSWSMAGRPLQVAKRRPSHSSALSNRGTARWSWP
jgi:hypothetical protein